MVAQQIPGIDDDFNPDEDFKGMAEDLGDEELPSFMDLDNVEDNPAFKIALPGYYQAILDGAEYARSQTSNNPMVTFTYKVDFGGEIGQRSVRDYCVTNNEYGAARLKRTLKLFLPNRSLSQVNLHQLGMELSGRRCTVQIVNRKDNNKVMRNNIQEVLPPRETSDSADFSLS